MTNEEFYKDELKVIMKRVTKDLLIDQIAVNKQGQPKCCIKQSCDDCIFNGHCTLVNSRLIGRRSRLIHRFWLETMKVVTGLKDILLNLWMGKFMRG